MICNNVDKQVCRLSNVNGIYCSVPYNTASQILSSACAISYIAVVRRLWEGNCLTEHRCPLARPLGMPSGHMSHASLRGDAWIHYYFVMDFTTNSNQTISNR